MVDESEELSEGDRRRVDGAEYILGLMSHEEARVFRGRLDSDPAARQDFAFWAERIASLADDIEPVAPPRGLRRRIMQNLFGTSSVKGRHGGEQRGWFGGGWAIPVTLAGLAAAVGLLMILSQIVTPVTNTPEFAAEIAAEDRSLVVLATYDTDDAVLRLERVAGQARPGRALQLWLIAGNAAPVSLGVLPESAIVRLDVEATLANLIGIGTLAISDEPPNGSPTGLPTGAVLATGRVTAL